MLDYNIIFFAYNLTVINIFLLSIECYIHSTSNYKYAFVESYSRLKYPYTEIVLANDMAVLNVKIVNNFKTENKLKFFFILNFHFIFPRRTVPFFTKLVPQGSNSEFLKLLLTSLFLYIINSPSIVKIFSEERFPFATLKARFTR